MAERPIAPDSNRDGSVQRLTSCGALRDLFRGGFPPRPSPYISRTRQLRSVSGLGILSAVNHRPIFLGTSTIEQFRSLWHAKGLSEISKPQLTRPREPLLFQ